ncbi:hypothetical protein [Streptomyces sp. NPDC054783]
MGRDLLLRDKAGKVVMDKDWREAMLDVHTDAQAQADRAGGERLDRRMRDQGLQGHQSGQLPTYTRVPQGLLTANDAKAFLSLFAAHAQGPAVGQKNTGGGERPVRRMRALRRRVRPPHDGDRVHRAGREEGVRGRGDRTSSVRRDLDLVPIGIKDYHRETWGKEKYLVNSTLVSDTFATWSPSPTEPAPAVWWSRRTRAPRTR